jgi:putative ABC transport system permease protein
MQQPFLPDAGLTSQMSDTLGRDLRYALRNMRRQRGYTFVILFTLALAIGGSTAVFSVVNAVLIRSLPYESPDQLVMVWNRYGKAKATQAYVSPPDFLDRKRESRTLENMAAIEETSVNLIGKGEPQRIRAARVSASLFTTLGVSPVVGRNFLEEEDQPGKNSVVILSNNLWKRQFGSSLNLIGETMNLSGTQHVVIGVMPANFWFPKPEIDLWIPIGFTPEQKSDDFRGNEYLTMIARARSGIPIAQVQAEMNAIAANVIVRVPDRRDFLTDAGWGSVVVPLHESLVGEVETALVVLMAAVTFLLLIGCANVVNLILARAGTREKEIAIRAVLGAGRTSVIRMLFVEAMLLAVAGGTIGILLAYGATILLPVLAPETLPRLHEINVDGSVLIYSLIVSMGTGVLIGLVPALRISMFRPYQSLKVEGTSSPAKSVHRFRSALVIAEIALALILATGAGLLAKSFKNLISVDPGFHAENRLVFTISLPSTQYAESPPIANFYQTLLQQIQSLPGVHSAGANVSLPMAEHNQTATFTVEGAVLRPGEPQPGFEYRVITPNYFRAMGIPFLSGRDFSLSDTLDSTRVAIIDEKLANRYWKRQNPIGRRIGFSNSSGTVRWRQVVGVVKHVKNAGLNEEGIEQIYFPHAQIPEPMMTVVIHSAKNPGGLISAIRHHVKSLDSNLPIYQIGTMDQIISRSIAQPRFNMMLFVLFAATALALAAVGIYGVLSYSVTERRKEIGIRMALGARPENVLLQIIRQSMTISFIGVCLGIAASMILSRFLQSLLFRMQPLDPGMYAITALSAMVIALLASTVPAKRAASVDPLHTLRGE